MIRGLKEPKKITKEAILELVDPGEIYSFFMPTSFLWNVPTRSPFPGRRDSSPSFVIYYQQDNFTHIDYGDSNLRGDVFSFVAQLIELSSFTEVLEVINNDMGLGLAGGISKPAKKVSKYKQPTIKDEKKPFLINIVENREYTIVELEYWIQYGITKENLLNAGTDLRVVSPQEIYMAEELANFSDEAVVIAYSFKNFWKIYCPYSKIKKWLSNVPFNYCYGLENIKLGQPIIVTKSVKDYLVVKNVFPNVCGVQAENTYAFSEALIKALDKASEVYIFFDSDAPGKKASKLITENYNFKHINIPDIYLSSGINDAAEFYKQCGKEALIELINSKIK